MGLRPFKRLIDWLKFAIRFRQQLIKAFDGEIGLLEIVNAIIRLHPRDKSNAMRFGESLSRQKTLSVLALHQPKLNRIPIQPRQMMQRIKFQ
jgi:hypothetical protein